MGVKKIFMILITVVMCVILGAFLINILLPNVTQQVVNAVEQNVYNATGMTFDFNGDGRVGSGGAVVQTDSFGGTAGDKSGANGSGAVGGFNNTTGYH